MIELKNVGKSFRISPGPGRRAGVVQAIRDISISIQAGSVIGVVGPNGAGKTTLFGLLLGFLEATSGNIQVAGMDPRAYVQRHGATYLPERFTIPRDWTVRAAVHALLSLDGSTRNADDVIADYELTRYATSKAHTLSRGTMQRLGMAQAFATPRNLVVLDEPTEGLDPVWRVRLREEVRRLASPERTVLVASHDLTEVERIADRVIILNGGTITEDIELQRKHDEQRDYTLSLASPHDSVFRLFSAARELEPGIYVVTADSALDMSTRLAALIEAGALVVSLNPSTNLEQRVTRAAQTETR